MKGQIGLVIYSVFVRDLVPETHILRAKMSSPILRNFGKLFNRYNPWTSFHVNFSILLSLVKFKLAIGTQAWSKVPVTWQQ